MSLPSLFSRWMDDLLQGSIPEEKQATCDNCAMLTEGEASSQSSATFRPDTKCCTYLPDLPNFLVGRVLRDEDPTSREGRETVEERISRGVGVNPLGLKQDLKFLTLYRGSRGAFGRNAALRCPHLLDDGRCGVWQHRESVCATWFCKHQRGATGLAFWTALRGLLKSIERSLSVWCVLKIGIDPDCLDQLFPAPIEGIPREISPQELDQQNSTPETQKALWQDWFGREKDFYQQCARLVDPLDWAAVGDICGPEVKARAQIVGERYKDLVSSEIPERLFVGKCQLVQISTTSATLSSYSGLDPVQMGRTLYEMLPFFDGRPIEEVRKAIKAAKGVTVSHDLLRRLVDHRILVGPAPKGV